MSLVAVSVKFTHSESSGSSAFFLTPRVCVFTKVDVVGGEEVVGGARTIRNVVKSPVRVNQAKVINGLIAG